MKLSDMLDVLGLISIISLTLALSMGMMIIMYALWEDIHAPRHSIRYVLMKKYTKKKDDIPVCKNITCINGEWKFEN